MPGFTTHYILGMKAYNDLPSNQLKHIIAKYRWLYQLGLQGPDMFFYNLPILRHRDYRNVGSYMHEHHVGDFFITYIQETLKIRSRQQQDQAIAYFCGFLCHYICDSICHPFIYGRIRYDVGKPGLKYHGFHAQLESEIDSLLLKKYKKKKPSQFNQAATICLNPQEIQFISHLLAACINRTCYPITYENSFRVTPRMIHRSILALRFGCRTLADPSGHKRDRLETLESVLIPSPLLSGKIVTDHVVHPRQSLNLDHETWTNPWDRRLASDASFLDLFHQALARCGVIFSLVNLRLLLRQPPDLKEMEEHKKISPGTVSGEIDFTDLIEELGSFSYHSGLATD